MYLAFLVKLPLFQVYNSSRCCQIYFLGHKVWTHCFFVCNSSKNFAHYWFFKWTRFAWNSLFSSLTSAKYLLRYFSKTFWRITLHKKCPYSELFWSAFFAHFSAFGRNTEKYSVSLRIQFECGKNVDPNNSEYGHFLRSVIYKKKCHYMIAVTTSTSGRAACGLYTSGWLSCKCYRKISFDLFQTGTAFTSTTGSIFCKFCKYWISARGFKSSQSPFSNFLTLSSFLVRTKFLIFPLDKRCKLIFFVVKNGGCFKGLSTTIPIFKSILFNNSFWQSCLLNADILVC